MCTKVVTPEVVNYNTLEDKLKTLLKDNSFRDQFNAQIPSNANEARAAQHIKINQLTTELMRNSKMSKKEALEHIYGIIDKWEQEQTKTFALPSHTFMRLVCNMFNGRTEKLLNASQRQLLNKSEQLRSPEEIQEAEALVQNAFSIEQVESFEEGEFFNEEKCIAIVSDNPYVQAKTEISGSNIQSRVESLAMYLDKTFGAEGMRHFLALIIGLEENGRTGWFDWDVNDHMERLGYKRNPTSGGYNTKNRKTARDIVSLFSSLYLSISSKKGKKKNKEHIISTKLFHIESIEEEVENSKKTSERIRLRADDLWYKNAAANENNKQYTKLLKKIVKESHQEHSILIKLVPQLSIDWRMQPSRVLSLKSLMERSGLDIQAIDGNRTKRIKLLEKELNYMKDNNYLGDWSHNGDPEKPLHKQDQPLSVNITLIPPEWLQNEMDAIEVKRQLFIPTTSKKTSEPENNSAHMTHEELNQLIQKSGLSVKAFAEKLGYSREAVSRMKNGKQKSISIEFVQKLKDTFPDLFTPLQ